jgi:hypothetical protein
VLTSSLALLGAQAGPWLLQLPPTEATPFFKDSLAEPASITLLLIGGGFLAAYGVVKRHRQAAKAATTPTYSAPQRRAA